MINISVSEVKAKMAESQPRKSFAGTPVPTTIKTDERIFKVYTYDGETFLVNLVTAKELLKNDEIKALWHLWNFKWERFGKSILKGM